MVKTCLSQPVTQDRVKQNEHFARRTAPAVSKKPTPAPVSEAGARPKYRVLVIEDDHHIARLISVNLDRAGLEARIAHDGQAGLDSFRDHPPHLILLDLMMPVMDGFQVCERIRGDSSVPIVIMTARLEPIHQMRGFRLGADDYVLKPFDPQLLVARVIAHLRRVYRYDGNQIHSNDKPEPQNQPQHYTPEHDVQERRSTPQLSRREQERHADVLSHMPEGWAGCSACNYMGPLTQFPRRNNGYNGTALYCPNCRCEGFIEFAVS